MTDPERDDSLAMALADLDTYEAEVAKLNRQVAELRGQRDEARAEAERANRAGLKLVEEEHAMHPVMEAAEAWLAHVRGPDAFLRKPNAELIKLADAVDAWRAAQPDQKAETVGDGLDALETLNRIAYGEAPETAPESTQADEQGADDGAGTEGSQAQGGAQGAQCRAVYKRPGPPEPGDRIVRCGRRKGHRGDHDEMIEGEAGNWWPQEPAPADPAGLDAAIEAAAQAISRYDWNAGLSRRVTVSDCQRDEADAAVRAAAPHLRAAALNEAAAAFREDFDSRKLYLGAEFSVWLMQYQRAGRIGGGE